MSGSTEETLRVFDFDERALDKILAVEKPSRGAARDTEAGPAFRYAVKVSCDGPMLICAVLQAGFEDLEDGMEGDGIPCAALEDRMKKG